MLELAPENFFIMDGNNAVQLEIREPSRTIVQVTFNDPHHIREIGEVLIDAAHRIEAGRERYWGQWNGNSHVVLDRLKKAPDNVVARAADDSSRDRIVSALNLLEFQAPDA